jgi:hypothetical protein
MKYLTIILFLSITYSQEKYNGQFRGHPCDDTEYRDDYGSPNWKNYGGWLSECDSLASAYSDSTFAIVLEKRHSKKLEEERKRQEEIDNIDTELDMDAMWENTIWNEIVDIGETIEYEVENITQVAGVRGAEAEDEAVALLYYRKSMKGLSKLELQRALGKLINRRQEMPDDTDTKKIDSYIYQLKIKLKKA